MRFGPSDLSTYVQRVLCALGVSEDGARTTADCLIAADLRGVASHGVGLLPIYARRLRRGTMEPRPVLSVIREGPAFVAVDGGNGLGPVAGAFAMDRAIALCRTSGIAAATVRRSNHFGAAAWYALRALEHDFVGLATSNGTPALAPWGGRSAFFGANPLAVAVPVLGAEAIVFDMATSVVSRAHIRERAARGEAIPEGWALDPAGHPTTSAVDAIGGALLPTGGPKGYGLALVLEVLAGALAGAGLSYENADLHAAPERPQGIGHFFLVIDPHAFVPDGRFPERVGELVHALRSVAPADGVTRVRVPGEAGAVRGRQNQVSGIALSSDKVAALARLGGELGIGFPSALASGENKEEGARL